MMRANDVTRWLRERSGYHTAAEVASGLGVRIDTAETMLKVLTGEGKVKKARVHGDLSWAVAIERNGHEAEERKRHERRNS